MKFCPKVRLAIGLAKGGKTEALLRLHMDDPGLVVITQDRTPARFIARYHHVLGEKAFAALHVRDGLFGAIAGCRLSAKTLYFTDYQLSLDGGLSTDIGLLDLARLAINTRANVLAEVTVFEASSFQTGSPFLSSIVGSKSQIKPFLTVSDGAEIGVIATLHADIIVSIIGGVIPFRNPGTPVVSSIFNVNQGRC